MPDVSRAFASMDAIAARAREAVERSWSRSWSKSGLIMPPSETRKGGSSTIARSMRSRTSSWDETPSKREEIEAPVSRLVVSWRSSGALSRPRKSCRSSRGSDWPRVKRFTRRAKSGMLARVWSRDERRVESLYRVLTASWRVLSSLRSVNGADSQSRRRRAPIGVRVVSRVLRRVGPPSTVGIRTSRSRRAAAGMYM